MGFPRVNCLPLQGDELNGSFLQRETTNCSPCGNSNSCFPPAVMSVSGILCKVAITYLVVERLLWPSTGRSAKISRMTANRSKTFGHWPEYIVSGGGFAIGISGGLGVVKGGWFGVEYALMEVRCEKAIEFLRSDLATLHDASVISKADDVRVRLDLPATGTGVQHCRHKTHTRSAEVQSTRGRPSFTYVDLNRAQMGARRNPSHWSGS
jgi:hypothetical protein